MCLHTVITEGQGELLWMGDIIKVNPWGSALPYFEVFFNFIVDVKSESLMLRFLSRGEVTDIQRIDHYVKNGNRSGFDHWHNKLIFSGTEAKGLFRNGDAITFNQRKVELAKNIAICNSRVESGDKEKDALFTTFDLELNNKGLTMVSLQYLLAPTESPEKSHDADFSFQIVGFSEILEGVHQNIKDHCTDAKANILHREIKTQFSSAGENTFLSNGYSMVLISTPDANLDITSSMGLKEQGGIARDVDVPFFLTYEEKGSQDLRQFLSTNDRFNLKVDVAY